MKKLMALVLALVLLSPAVALAGSATDAALGLGAFAVFNQILGGVGVFGGFAPRATVYAAPAPVYAAPAPLYAPPPPVYAPPPPVYALPAPVVVTPAPVVVAPPVVVHQRVIVRSHRHHPAAVYYSRPGVVYRPW